jgi:hypothetical protein
MSEKFWGSLGEPDSGTDDELAYAMIKPRFIEMINGLVFMDSFLR